MSGGLPVIHVPARLGHDRAAFRDWLSERLVALRADELIVDSFPGGILGELCGMPLPPVRHVARLLRWDEYARRLDGPLPRFEITYVVEPPGRELSGPAEKLELPLPELEAASEPLAEGPHWLVVHSGPDSEVVALVRYAADLRADDLGDAQIIVIAPRAPSWLPPNSQWRNVYPIAPFLAHAGRIITAAGFNVMQETLHVRDRHDFVPFPRALDAQFVRAEVHRGARRRQVLFS